MSDRSGSRSGRRCPCSVSEAVTTDAEATTRARTTITRHSLLQFLLILGEFENRIENWRLSLLSPSGRIISDDTPWSSVVVYSEWRQRRRVTAPRHAINGDSSSSSGSVGVSLLVCAAQLILSAFRYHRYGSPVAAYTRCTKSNVDLGDRWAKRCRYCVLHCVRSPVASVTVTTSLPLSGGAVLQTLFSYFPTLNTAPGISVDLSIMQHKSPILNEYFSDCFSTEHKMVTIL